MKDKIDNTIDRLEYERKLKEQGIEVERVLTLDDFYADAERRYEQYLKERELGDDPCEVAEQLCGRHA